MINGNIDLEIEDEMEEELEEEFEEDEDYDDPQYCSDCSGSGMGRYDGTNCRTCKGTGCESSEDEDDGDYFYDKWKDEKNEK